MTRPRARSALGVTALGFLWVLALIGGTRHAAAQDNSRMIAIYLEAPGSEEVERTIRGLLPPQAEVVPEADFIAALRDSGWRGQMGNIIAVPKARAALVRALRAALKKVNARFLIAGRIRRTRTLELEVWLIGLQQDDETITIDRGVLLPRDPSAREAHLKEALDWHLAVLGPTSTSVPPPPPAARPVPAPPRTEQPTPPPVQPTRTPHEMATTSLSVGVSYAMISRAVDYAQALSSNLRPYRLFVGHAVSGEIEAYPLATTAIPFLQDLGLRAEYTRSLGLQSVADSGPPLPTQFDGVGASIRVRIRTGNAPRPVLGAFLGGRWMKWAFDVPPETPDPTRLTEQLPAVEYLALGGGADGRVQLGPVRLHLGGELIAPLSAGELAERFRSTKVFGFGVRAGVAVGLVSGFEATLAAEYLRIFYSFDSQPTDQFAAETAYDQLPVLRAGIGYVQ